MGEPDPLVVQLLVSLNEKIDAFVVLMNQKNDEQDGRINAIEVEMAKRQLPQWVGPVFTSIVSGVATLAVWYSVAARYFTGH